MAQPVRQWRVADQASAFKERSAAPWFSDVGPVLVAAWR